MNNKNTDSQKLKYLHLNLKGKRSSLKSENASPEKQIVFWSVGIGVIIIVIALCLWIFL
jgi:uncharacterized protein YhaN